MDIDDPKPDNDTAIAEFVAERHEVLESGDLKRVQAFFAKHNRGKTIPDNLMETVMHKAITGDLGLPLEYRKKSAAWLRERNMGTFDDSL